MTTEDTHTTTEAPPPEPPPSGYPPLQALRRSRTDRKVAGVSGGLGRHTGIDPLVFRILFVVLAVFGGSGILLYILGWLLVPDEGEVESEAVKVVNRRTNAATATTVILGIVALCLGLIFVGSVADTGVGFGGFGALVVVVVVVLLLARSGPVPPRPRSRTARCGRRSRVRTARRRAPRTPPARQPRRRCLRLGRPGRSRRRERPRPTGRRPERHPRRRRGRPRRGRCSAVRPCRSP